MNKIFHLKKKTGIDKKVLIMRRCLIVLILLAVFFVVVVSLKRSIWNGENTKLQVVQTDANKKRLTDGRIYLEDSEVSIVIDPGNGGKDVGAMVGSLYEKDLNLDISLKLGKLLEEQGIKVIYTRDTDVDVGLDERVNIATSIDATLFISVHNNAMPNNDSYRGTETLYCAFEVADENRLDGQKLAQIIQDKLVATLGTVDHGVINRPNLVVLRKTTMPAVIAEIAYMTNYNDRQNLMDEGFRQKAAEALEQAVVEAIESIGAQKDNSGKWIIKHQ